MKELNDFEKDIRQSFHLPEVMPNVVELIKSNVTSNPTLSGSVSKPIQRASRTWRYAFVILLILAALFVAIGPSEVIAQIQKVLGYRPDMGVVDTTTLYQLVEPISDTKEEINLTIVSAYINADQALIIFTTPYLPSEILPEKFGDPACHEQATLIFSDGSVIQNSKYHAGIQSDGSVKHHLLFKNPGEKDFSQATLVIPCLEGTAEGKGPQNWQFPLAFTPSADNLEIFPVTMADFDEPVELDPETMATMELSEFDFSDEPYPATIVDGDRQEEMAVLGTAEMGNTTWVLWGFPMINDFGIQENGYLYLQPFSPTFYDANGVELPALTHELQVQLWDFRRSLMDQLSDREQLSYAGSACSYAVPSSGVTFPVYAKVNVFERSFPEKDLFADITFDGSLIQRSDEPVLVNQDVVIGEIKFRLVSIESNDYGGYTFNFDGAEGRVVQCKVEILDRPSNMAGSNSFSPDDKFSFYQSLMFSSVPSGQLTVRISQPAVLGDLISFIGSWSPDNQ